MDQRAIAGVGNIYANEALWRAGIDPSRAARSRRRRGGGALRDAIVDVLTESIAHRGTSFRDYRDASGGARRVRRTSRGVRTRGRGVSALRRRGSIGTHAIDGRTTVLCARCQK